MKKLFLALVGPIVIFGFFMAGNLFLVVPAAQGQTHTFCAEDLPCPSMNISNLNSTLFVCNTSLNLYQTVESALSALPTNGGTVKVCPGFRETFTTAPITVGSLTQGVLLDLTGVDINITCNSTSGASTWCWLIGDGGKILGNGPHGPALSAGASMLTLASTANVAGLVSPAIKTGGQEYFELNGLQLIGSCSATVGTALVDVEGVFDGSEVSDNLIYIANAPLLRIAGNASTSTGQTIFKKNFINGGGCTNAIPIVITGTASTFTQNEYFVGGSAANAGPSQPAIKIDGLGASGCTNISFSGFYAESDQTGPTNGIIIKDCHNVSMSQFQIFGSGANAPTNAVQITQSAPGLTHDITLQNFTSNSTTTVNNTITGQTWAGGQPIWQRYVYGGNSAIGGNDTIESAGTGQDVGQDLTGIWHVSANRGVRAGNIYSGANPAYDLQNSAAGGTKVVVYNSGGGLIGNGLTVDAAARLHSFMHISDQGTACTNGELALSAGWQSTGSATVTGVAGTGQTCSWTVTTGTTTAANPTITDTLTNALPAATTRCWMFLEYGPASTHTAAAGEGFAQTTLSATAPIFTFNGTPTAAGKTYLVVRTCGP